MTFNYEKKLFNHLTKWIELIWATNYERGRHCSAWNDSVLHRNGPHVPHPIPCPGPWRGFRSIDWTVPVEDGWIRHSCPLLPDESQPFSLFPLFFLPFWLMSVSSYLLNDRWSVTIKLIFFSCKYVNKLISHYLYVKWIQREIRFCTVNITFMT